MDWLWHILYVAIIVLQCITLDFCHLCKHHSYQTKQKEKNKKIKEKMEALTRTYHPTEENFENYLEHFKENIKKAGIILKNEEDWPDIPWYENWDDILKNVLWNKICENFRVSSEAKIWPDNHKNTDENLYGYMNLLKEHFESINKNIT